MELQELREELITYIHLADEKKLQALQVLLLDDAEEEPEAEGKWWEDEAFVADLNERTKRFESGEDKGYTMEEVKAHLEKRKADRYATQLQD